MKYLVLLQLSRSLPRRASAVRIWGFEVIFFESFHLLAAARDPLWMKPVQASAQRSRMRRYAGRLRALSPPSETQRSLLVFLHASRFQAGSHSLRRAFDRTRTKLKHLLGRGCLFIATSESPLPFAAITSKKPPSGAARTKPHLWANGHRPFRNRAKKKKEKGGKKTPGRAAVLLAVLFGAI